MADYTLEAIRKDAIDLAIGTLMVGEPVCPGCVVELAASYVEFILTGTVEVKEHKKDTLDTILEDLN